ncbi:MAG: 1-deoxy-D-xylulose-5-phosphate reductoisomerase [Clostridiales bacterium]|jgi:1-deoxy-D-xylulose-5-phosphate reductoisomerase|nr:1-deoxy-D-xylulose-5-phosphate reductoisomerase [Clostridiales bacterium]
MTGIVINGSTGSVGRQTLNVVRRHPDKLFVAGLTAGSNVGLLLEQAVEFRPSFAGIADENAYKILREGVPAGTHAAAGADVAETAAGLPGADLVVAAIVGAAGLRSTAAAIRAKKRIALANKETLVACGKLITDLARAHGIDILPVDSEHSAVYQALKGERIRDVARIILTASGGPFRDVKSTDALQKVTVEEALAHPNWSMGKKISVDSATMMNKGLELIEAHWLFGAAEVDYILHRESIVHSMVEFADGNISAVLGISDMELPIGYALFYPERVAEPAKTLELFGKTLHFERPNEALFPMPAYAREALALGGTAPALLNAANEAAVSLFLERKIGFLDIIRIVRHTLDTGRIAPEYTLDDVLALHDDTVKRIRRPYE